jgi:agmatinase
MRENSARLDMPFVGIPSFLRSPVRDVRDLGADVAVVGAPTDEGSPFMPGSRFGPRAIREHSLRFVVDPPGYYDVQERQRFLAREMEEERLVDVGDADVLPTNVSRTFDNITAMIDEIVRRGAMPVVLGGDHSVTYPVVRAFREPLHVVHLDAHLDYMPFVHGVQFSNQHAFRHIRTLANVQGLVQVGIRSIRNTEAMLEDSLQDGNRVVTMEDFRELGPLGVAELVPEGVALYVSIDVDVLDLSLVPGCVSAEPNGMDYRDLRGILFALAERAEVVGFDVVEVNPQLDVGTGVTSYLAAHTVVEFLGRICRQPHWREARARRRSESSVTSEWEAAE